MTEERTEATLAEVTAAVREYAARPGTVTISSDYTVLSAVAEALHVNFGLARNSWAQGALENRLSGQLTRALNKLTVEGVLRKQGPRDPGPDGRTSQWAKYWLPAAWDEQAEKTRAEHAAEQELENRWREVHARLAALGFPPAAPHYCEPELPADAWERVLGLAERGWAELLRKGD
jgi:hypothetical protein